MFNTAFFRKMFKMGLLGLVIVIAALLQPSLQPSPLYFETEQESERCLLENCPSCPVKHVRTYCGKGYYWDIELDSCRICPFNKTGLQTFQPKTTHYCTKCIICPKCPVGQVELEPCSHGKAPVCSSPGNHSASTKAHKTTTDAGMNGYRSTDVSIKHTEDGHRNIETLSPDNDKDSIERLVKEVTIWHILYPVSMFIMILLVVVMGLYCQRKYKTKKEANTSDSNNPISGTSQRIRGSNEYNAVPHEDHDTTNTGAPDGSIVTNNNADDEPGRAESQV